CACSATSRAGIDPRSPGRPRPDDAQPHALRRGADLCGISAPGSWRGGGGTTAGASVGGIPQRPKRLVVPGTAGALVLAHQRRGVAVGEVVLLGEPVAAFLAAAERRAVLDGGEPLGDGTSCDLRNGGGPLAVRLRRVVPRPVAPPGLGPLPAASATANRMCQPPDGDLSIA